MKSSKITNVFRGNRRLIFILLIKISKTLVTKKVWEYNKIFIEKIFEEKIIDYISKTKNIFVFNFLKEEKLT